MLKLMFLTCLDMMSRILEILAWSKPILHTIHFQGDVTVRGNVGNIFPSQPENFSDLRALYK